MTATLEQIHRDPAIIDRAISRREPLEIISNGVVTGVLTPTECASALKSYEGNKRLSPSGLCELAEKLIAAPDDETAARIKEEMLYGFYGKESA
jgi:hypothetical protein